MDAILRRNLFLGVTVDSYSCLDPGIPVNGIRYGQDFSIGSTVSFGCDSGYRLSHEEPLVCEKNHWWSHPLPTCDGKYQKAPLIREAQPMRWRVTPSLYRTTFVSCWHIWFIIPTQAMCILYAAIYVMYSRVCAVLFQMLKNIHNIRYLVEKNFSEQCTEIQ